MNEGPMTYYEVLSEHTGRLTHEDRMRDIARALGESLAKAARTGRVPRVDEYVMVAAVSLLTAAARRLEDGA